MMRLETDLHRSNANSWLFYGGMVTLGVALVPLYFFNPVDSSFFPRCIFHSFTGLDCPGCGGLRATHQLLHGHIVAAFKLNALFIGLLPIGIFFGLRQVVFAITGRLWHQPFKNPRWAFALAGMIIAFGVLRNLPWRTWFAN
jgi:hypothetical protein